MKNIVIKASAGTGKTYRLSLHYIKLLLKGVNYENILITTFTRKATQEIKDRIFQHLDYLLKGSKSLARDLAYLGIEKIDYDEVREIKKNLLFNKSNIRISTIDGFINSIFNKFVVPYFNLYGYKMVTSERNLDIIEETLENLIQSEKKFTEVEKFFSVFMEKDVTNYLKWISEFVNNRWKFLLVDKKRRSYKKSLDIEESFKLVVDQLEELVGSKGNGKKLSEYVKDDFKEVVSLRLANKNFKSYLEKNFSIFLNHIGENGFWDRVKLRRNKENFKEYKILTDRYNQFKKNLSSFIFNNKLIPLEKEIIKISEIIFKEYDKIKFTKKEFTHDDILIYTFKFIYQFSDHSKEVFKDVIDYNKTYILIDEFQDTSCMQWFIVKLLAKEARQFIAVGDEKQSIYRWRGGEKELFVRLGDILKCKTNYLETCYRSQKEIIKFTNNLFSNLGVIENAVKYLPTKKRGYVEFSLSEKKDLKKNLVETIIKRKISFKNTAILARTNADLEEISMYLNEYKIPHVKESSLSLLDHKAIRPLFYLMKFVSKSEIYDLIAFLRSDVVNIPSKSMKKITKIKHSVEMYFDNVHDKLELEDNVVEVLSRIKQIKNEGNYDIKIMIEEFGFTKVFYSASDLKNLTKFYEISRKFTDITSFIEFAQENIKSETMRQVGIEEDNSIKLMTIHKSKGLEFETVFLAWNFSSRFSNTRNKLHLNLEFNSKFEEVSDFCFTSSEMSNILKYYGKNYEKIDREKEVAEELNNLYVATTRAKKNLILLASFDKSLKLLEGINEKKVKNENDAYVNRVKNALLKTAGRENITSLFVDPITLGKIEQKSDKHHKETSNKVTEDIKIFYEEDRKINRPDNEAEIVKHREKAVKKMREGIVAHYFLSLIKKGEEREIEEAEKKTINIFFNKMSREKIEKVITSSKEILKNSFAFQVDKEDEIFNESTVVYKNREYRIDRLIMNRNKKHIRVIDYKTGSHEEEQISNYKSAIQDIYPNYSVESQVIDIKMKFQKS
ncbi:MAG TPA: hypothetical protein DEP20_02920 [Fusobacteria bacterium]|nr:hypothetical protein [Fusobacteriota bacterium]|tara:strand:- start:20237 stop:23269 length:3033 start_codon:yes stop_codon:yes gene_type:complete